MLLKANVRKMLVDGEQWASWHGYHIPVSEEYIVIWTPSGSKMHWKPGTWIASKHQLSFFWPEAWYTIHAGYDSTGRCISGYCDVVLPTASYTNDASEVIYIDLYIDVVVREDYSVYTKDQEVFDRAAERFPVVARSRQQAFAALDWLEQHAQHWTGPFEVIPRQLVRTDFVTLDPDVAAASLQERP